MPEEPHEIPRELQEAHHVALGGLLPAVVHRANNHLSVIRGTLEVISGLDPPQARLLDGEAEALGELLDLVARQARHHPEPSESFSFTEVADEVARLVGCAARFARLAFRVRLPGDALPVDGPRPRVTRLLTSLAAGRLEALVASCEERRDLRLAVHVDADRARLVVTDRGAVAARERPALAREVEELPGLEVAQRRRGDVHRLVLALPRLAPAVPRALPAAADAPRILLLQPPGEEAELCAALLSESGHRVVHRTTLDPALALPPPGFDLVLLDVDLLAGDPHLAGALSASAPPGVGLLAAPGETVPGALPCVQKPIRPRALLTLVSDLRAATPR